MPILNVALNVIGGEGNIPSFIYINTNDTMSRVQETGYLNDLVSQGTLFSEAQLAVVITRESPSSRSLSVNLYNIVHSSGNWSLTENISGGVLSDVLASGNIFVGNGSNIATASAVSGDIGIDNTGNTTIQNGVVTTAKMATTTANSVFITDGSGNPSVTTTLPTAVQNNVTVTTSQVTNLVPYINSNAQIGTSQVTGLTTYINSNAQIGPSQVTGLNAYINTNTQLASPTQVTGLTDYLSPTLVLAFPTQVTGLNSFINLNAQIAPAQVTGLADYINQYADITEAQVQNLIGDLAVINSSLSAKQPLDAGLTSISGLANTAGNIVYTTGTDTFANAPITALGLSVLSDSTQAAMNTTIGSLPAAGGTVSGALTLNAGININTPGGINVTSSGNQYFGTVSYTTNPTTVSTTAVQANSLIFLTEMEGTANLTDVYVNARNPGVGFSIATKSSQTGGTIAWMIINRY